MIIKNIYLRFLLLPIAILSWVVQLFCFSLMGSVGFFFGLMGFIAALIFGDEIDWHMQFILMMGWWIYYPWLWWYRYFKYGNLSMLEEFK